MASPTNPSVMSQLSGLFKEVYSKDGLLDLMPSAAKLLPEVPFEKGQTLGDKFIVPLTLSDEQGVTYAASGAGNVLLGGAVAMNTQKAMVDGAQLFMQSAIDFESAARSQAGGPAAFASATQIKVKSVLSSGRKRLELGMWYGQSGLGVIESKSNVSSTRETLVISAASFAPLMWVGKKNAKLVVYNGTTQIGESPGAASPTNVYTVYSVDISARSITVDGTANDITALNAITPDVNHKIFFESSISGSAGTVAHADQLGLYSQITSSATRFGVNPAIYDLWGGNTFAVGGVALTFNSLMSSVAQAVNRGLDSDVTVWVNPNTWTDLLKDVASLRKYDASYNAKKAEQGAEDLEFHGVSGKIKIKAHGCVKGGEAFVLPMEELIRIGAADFSFNVPGAGGMGGDSDQVFFSDPNYAGYLFRAYSHQQIVLLAPAKAVVLTGIVNSTA